MPSLDRLADFLGTLPRISIGIFPTPLVPLERLSADLGIDLWMKRDECTGLALGGNKVRKLEFVLADARARGYETVVTVGPLTSNHTMMTAAAARRAGMQVHCVVGGAPPQTPSGNLLLLDYLGAALHFTSIDYAAPTPDAERELRETCQRVTADTNGYWIPGGATMPQAEPGYMNAVLEICAQRGGRFDFDHVVLAIGTGSTTTGVMLGLALGGLDTSVEAVRVLDRRAVEEVFHQPSPRGALPRQRGPFRADPDGRPSAQTDLRLRGGGVRRAQRAQRPRPPRPRRAGGLPPGHGLHGQGVRRAPRHGGRRTDPPGGACPVPAHGGALHDAGCRKALWRAPHVVVRRSWHIPPAFRAPHFCMTSAYCARASAHACT